MDYFAETERVLRNGLPPAPSPSKIGPDSRYPVACCRLSSVGAALFVTQRSDGGYHAVYTMVEARNGTWSPLEQGDDVWVDDPFTRPQPPPGERAGLTWFGWTSLELDNDTATVLWGIASAGITSVSVGPPGDGEGCPVAPESGAFIALHCLSGPPWFDRTPPVLTLYGHDARGDVIATGRVRAVA